MNSPTPRIVVVMPALDEERALPLVLADLEHLQRSTPEPLLAEVVVVDNGSRDRTPDIAARAGATVLREPRRGYGAACLRALGYLRGQPPDVVVFMDADHSDHAEDIPALLEPLRAGAHDLVIGSRTRGRSERGALLPQARFGNWLATGLIRARYGHRYTDLGPFRAVRWRTLEEMRLVDRDFGWTVEMQVRALQIGARVTEVPVRYRRRVGRSKVSGTLGGSVRAGVKILATLWRLRTVRAAALALGALAGAAADREAAGLPAFAHVTPLLADAGAAPAPASADSVHFDHTPWTRLVAAYVDTSGRVAYRQLQRHGRPALDTYLHSLAAARPDAWPERDQIAFWLNAYNAGIVTAVLDGFSAESLIGRGRIFKFWKFEVAGRQLSLDQIEHEILRARLQEPRIHFALVCAAMSCPRLRREAYVGDRLEGQLDDQARTFFNDSRRNYFDPTQGQVRLSKVLEWFREDFERDGPLLVYVSSFVDDAHVRDWLRSGANIDVGFLDYDWTLNAQPDQRPERPRQ
jgi:uncharacterized protein DUF547/glycosyl transferase family 2